MKKENLIPLEYEHLDWENHNFSDESMEKLKAMLSIRNDGNLIYICHPRHLFDFVSEDFRTKEIRYVDFNSINIAKMMRYNDFGRYSLVDQICYKSNNQFTYFLKKASHMMKKYQREGLLEFSFPFAVLEEIHNGFEKPQYFVRGIINCSQNGFSLAFNPLAIKNIPNKSIFEKGLYFGNNS